MPKWQIDSKGRNTTYELLTYVPNFIISVGLPDTEEGELFQEVALERLKELQNRWALEDVTTNPKGVKLEFFTVYAYLLEYERALTNDMPLVPLTFYVMLLFTCIVFHRLGMSSGKSPTGVEPSRFSLGILSTFTIGMSLMSGTLFLLYVLCLYCIATKAHHVNIYFGYNRIRHHVLFGNSIYEPIADGPIHHSWCGT